MAVPNNYIDKIKKDGDSRMISPAADMVRVDNDNFEGTDLDEVLDEVAQAIGEAGEGGYAPPAGGIPKTDLAPAVQASLAKADSALQPSDLQGYATTDDVDDAVAALVSSAPPTLDTLKELADALGDDPNFATTMATQLGNKVDKETGKGLSTNDYTTAEKTKLAGIAAGAEVNVQPNWTQTNTSADDYIKNKPDLSTYATKTEVNAKQDVISDLSAIRSGAALGATALQSHQPLNTINGQSLVGNGNITVVGEKGDKGDTGSVTVTDGVAQITIVNDLTTGGTGDALSAEMGKRLALLAGTYADAWARSKAIASPFCWLWVETVNGAAISKPIWHKGNSVFIDAAGAIINVTAAAVPNAPTITGATSGSTVPKNTQITITPESGSALYYSIDGGTTYNVSDAAVTIKLETAGSVSIVAYCSNNAGNSSNATLSVTVAGTAVPSFSQPSGEVARGGSVAISVPAGGELHYKVNSGAWQTASGTSVSIPITGATTIQAYNVQDGDTSNTVSNTYTMAALAAPTMTMSDTTGTANQFPDGGGTVSLDASAGTIYYTTDDSTPTTSSTQYSQPIQVTSAMTIKAIAVDEYGSSAVTENAYTVLVVPKFRFKVKLNGDSAVTVGAPFLSDGSIKYTCVVDWGDGSTTTLNNQYASSALCNHSYSYPFTDNVDEDGNVTITIKPNGNSLVVPNIDFIAGLINTNGVSRVRKILENSLTCGSNVKLAGTNLEYISADAYSNNTLRQATFKDIGSNLSAPTECGIGLFANLTTNANGLSSCANMFQKAKISLTEQHINHLKGVIGNVTTFDHTFSNFTGICAIPDDFFGNIADGTVTSFAYLTQGSTVTGDAGKLYNGDSSVPYSGMKDLLASGGAYNMALAGPNLTNKTSVPNAWKQ